MTRRTCDLCGVTVRVLTFTLGLGARRRPAEAALKSPSSHRYVRGACSGLWGVDDTLYTVIINRHSVSTDATRRAIETPRPPAAARRAPGCGRRPRAQAAAAEVSETAHHAGGTYTVATLHADVSSPLLKRG